MLFPFKSCILQLDLAGLIWLEPATANLNCRCEACQMPCGNFHYYLVTKLNTDETSGTRKLQKKKKKKKKSKRPNQTQHIYR